MSLSVIFKLGIIIWLVVQGIRSKTASRQRLLLMLVLIGAAVADSAWVLKLVHSLFLPFINENIVSFWIRLAWAFSVVQYQAQGLFIESLIEKTNLFSARQKFFLSLSCIFLIYFAGVSLIQFGKPTNAFMLFMQQAFSVYSLCLLIPISVIISILKIRQLQLPRILRQQLKLFIICFILPHTISDILQVYPFNFSPEYVASSYAFVGISAVLLTLAIYYSIRKVMGLRFLNSNSHVQSHRHYGFIDGFKEALEQLSHATNMKELGHITQKFFKETFEIKFGHTHLYIRNIDPLDLDSEEKQEFESDAEEITEQLLTTPNPKVTKFLQDNKILIYDELAFTNFYEENSVRKAMVEFLEDLNVDIFLPIFKRDTVIAYITVDRFARTNFYSNVERDEILVFAQFLGNIINLIQNRNLEHLIHQQKELKEELYSKHREINQYKESIRSFLKQSHQDEIGIIFYKNRRFTLANQNANKLITINPNTHPGHPVIKSLKQVANTVQKYKSPHSCLISNNGDKLVISAVPNIEQNNVIIIIYRPGVSDILKQQVDQLTDPSKWDYLLYLETTKSGKLINQLIPGSSETLLNFKIDLLKVALSSKSILLEIPEEDMLSTVEILHHISMRETLHILDLKQPATNNETTIKLFGVNQIYGLTQKEKPLLEKLDGADTLFIKNIQFLEHDAQEHLAEYLKYGFYRVFKSDKKVASNVRIICSTNQDLQPLVKNGTFSQNLFNELNKTTLIMPRLYALPKNELGELVEDLTQQAIKGNEFNALLELSDRDKNRLAQQCPVSLHELKDRIQHLLTKKSQENNIQHETFQPVHEIEGSSFAQAAQMGKHALKDPKIMAMLWNKFKSQNKIAAFLGVNRSSVNRRCKEYNLH